MYVCTLRLISMNNGLLIAHYATVLLSLTKKKKEEPFRNVCVCVCALNVIFPKSITIEKTFIFNFLDRHLFSIAML